MQYLIADMWMRGLIEIEKPDQPVLEYHRYQVKTRAAILLSMQYDINWAWVRYMNQTEGTAPTPEEIWGMARIGFPAPKPNKK